MSWRPSRGQALEQEWRSFGESADCGSSSLDATAEHRVIDLAEVGLANTALDPIQPDDRPKEPTADPLLAARLTVVQREAEGRSERRSDASAEEIRRLTVEFRRSAVSLAVGSDDADAVAELGRQAGAALVQLAAAGAGEILGDVLRPDLGAGDATWTVACYQIGDLSPSSLRDFSAPVDAVGTLSDCENPAHVAAELIVTNGDGLRWTAMVRSGSSVAFQLLASATSGSTPGDAGASLRAARNRWEDRLLSWAANPSSGLGSREPEGAAPRSAVSLSEPAPTVAAPVPATGGYPGATGLQVEARLLALEKHAVASSTDQLEMGGELRALRKASRDARKEARRLNKRVERLEEEVSRLRQELAAASQRASLSELGLSALTATVVSSGPSLAAPAEAAAVVVVPQPTRVPSQTHPGTVIRSEWAVQRLRAWCDRRLARSGSSDHR